MDVATTATVHRRRWWTLAVLCLSLLVIGLDNTILNVALPTLVEDLGASASQQQWMVDSYVLVFAGLLLTAGMLATGSGAAAPSSWAWSSSASVRPPAAFASSAGMLIARPGGHGHRRRVHHAGDAVDPDQRLHRRRRAGARPSASGPPCPGWGIAIGPVTGGCLLEHFWWGSVFLVNVPVVASRCVAGRFLVPESRDPAAAPARPGRRPSCRSSAWPRLLYGDHRGAVAGLDRTAGGRQPSPSASWCSPRSWCGSSTPTTRCSTCASSRTPASRAASVAITLVFFALFGTIFFLTQYLQFVLGYGDARGRASAVAPMRAGADDARRRWRPC